MATSEHVAAVADPALAADVTMTVIRTTLARRIDASGDCWLWTGGQTRGYGHLSYWSRIRKCSSSIQAHRFVWRILVGPIPEGLTLHHMCINPQCVNPDHLTPLPMVDNTMLGASPHAMNARKSACPRGHLLAGDNLGTGSKGERICIECRRARGRRRDARVLPCPLCGKHLSRASRTRHRRFGCSTKTK